MTASAPSPTNEATPSGDDLDTAEKLDRTLDQWRTRIDKLKVQVDLASLDVREDLTKRLEATENVYLAVRSRLSDTGHDARKGVATLRESVDQMLVDLRRAYDDAEAVVRRSRAS